MDNGEIISGERRERRKSLWVELWLFGELRLPDCEAIEVGARDGQALHAKVAGDGESAVDPTRKSVEERIGQKRQCNGDVTLR